MSQVLGAVDVDWLLCAARQWSFAAVSWAVAGRRRERDEYRLNNRVRKWSLGVTGALGGSPWVAFMIWDADNLGFLSSGNC